MSVANNCIAACELVSLLVVTVDDIEHSYLSTIRIAYGDGVLGYIRICGCLPCGPVHNLNGAGLDAHGIAASLRIILAYDK